MPLHFGTAAHLQSLSTNSHGADGQSFVHCIRLIDTLLTGQVMGTHSQLAFDTALPWGHVMFRWQHSDAPFAIATVPSGHFSGPEPEAHFIPMGHGMQGRPVTAVRGIHSPGLHSDETRTQ